MENVNVIAIRSLFRPDGFRSAVAQKGNACQLDQFLCQAPGFGTSSSLLLVWLAPNDLLYWASSFGMTPGSLSFQPPATLWPLLAGVAEYACSRRLSGGPGLGDQLPRNQP
ncbi:hypothetical protein [Synechococcus sp. CCY 9618]|uniref:hypothetical protein n=1 Tax=Synechococcus sp. CCY 9618 TaxID=2815602 RepID=UPI001C2468AB|nr:hypothetical protein [Synechococcus sp. CCY 9618]